MSTAVKILLSLLGAGYILSPYDAMPDMRPVLGQMDDLFVLGLLMYYVWRWGWFRRYWKNLLGRGDGVNASGPGQGRTSGPGPGARVPRDPYEVLGLTPDAGPDEIRRAYHEASQRYHPDKVSPLGPGIQGTGREKISSKSKKPTKPSRTGGAAPDVAGRGPPG